jgi:MarR family transcriptional regulator, lower aerobic nicotinate degradation pathway regulator
MRRDKLDAVTPPADAAEQGRYLLDEQVGFLLRVAMQHHTSIFMTRMIEGLTQTQFAALAKLYEVGPCSQNHLGRLIYLDAATIKGVVDRLNARGFLTARGRQVTAAAQLVAAEITAATLAPLSEDERSAVVKLLRKLG